MQERRAGIIALRSFVVWIEPDSVQAHTVMKPSVSTTSPIFRHNLQQNNDRTTKICRKNRICDKFQQYLAKWPLMIGIWEKGS